MIEIDANVARYTFEAAHLAPETFQVATFTGTEEIGRPYRFELDLVSKDPYIEFSDLINQPATLTMVRGLDVVPVHGCIVDVEQAGRIGDAVAYRAVLVPRLWYLSLNFQTRVFQRSTVEEIVLQVLDGIPPLTVRFELGGAYAPRAYCVQYEESDLDFLHRLLEYEGISYFFEHDGGEETVVFTDMQGVFPRSQDGEVLYRHGAGMAAPLGETVHELVCREQVVPGRVRLRDYNPKTPDVQLEAESQLNEAMPGTRYEYGEHFENLDAGRRLARIRNEEIECGRRVLHGASDCVGFRSGTRFGLVDHYRVDFNVEYLLTRVEHAGDQRAAMGPGVGGDGQAAESLYRNTFTCIPANVTFRPQRRTRVPRVPGVITAFTEAQTPDDPYAFLDDDGAYRARMHFDRRTADEAPRADASAPIRMKQPYSGRDYGVHCPNHDGTEMIIACINGDPNRPMALGTVHNADKTSPVTSANRPQTMIRTEGRNELSFDDTKNEENVYLHATKNHTVRVRNNETITVDNVQKIRAGNYQVMTAALGSDELTFEDAKQGEQYLLARNNQYVGSWEADQYVMAENIQKLHAGNYQVMTSAVDFDELTFDEAQQGDQIIIALKNQYVGSWEADQYFTAENQHIDVTKDREARVTGNDRIIVEEGERTVEVSEGNDTLTCPSGDIVRRAVFGKYDLHAMGGEIRCSTKLTLVCGESKIEMTPTEIVIDSPLVKINC